MQTNFLSPLPRDFRQFLKGTTLSEEGILLFRATMYDYYHKHKRAFAWRITCDPYAIVVSEIMLQQTQTDRVKHKYELFMSTFPTIEHLAHASTAEVLRVWQGLGYNRRALALHACAQKIMQDYGGLVPQEPENLQTFKGIGAATAASICAFAFNIPTVFIETNIRAVFIHHFFADAQEVHDKALVPLVEQTLDREQPRIWYYALMDYGVMLKKTYKNPSRKSAHYSIQSKFEGSRRQLRGKVIKELSASLRLSFCELIERIGSKPDILEPILQELLREGFIRQNQDTYFLAE